MQEEDENLVFFNARYRCLNEKLATWNKNQTLIPYNLNSSIKLEDRMDQL